MIGSEPESAHEYIGELESKNALTALGVKTDRHSNMSVRIDRK